jgi:cellulose synthase operon protein C
VAEGVYFFANVPALWLGGSEGDGRARKLALTLYGLPWLLRCARAKLTSAGPFFGASAKNAVGNSFMSGTSGLRLLPTVLASMLALGLAGCMKPNEDKLVETVRAQIAAGKLKDATLELRSYLQDKPQSAQAHFLLGQLFVKTGNWPEGERELQRAQERGHTPSEVMPALIDVKLQLEKVDEVLRVFGEKALAPGMTSQSKALIAKAYLMKGEQAKAKALLDQVLQAEPKHALAQVLQFRSRSTGAPTDETRQEARALAQRHPQEPDAQTLVGDLEAGTNPDAAMAAYRKALELQPANVRAHTALIGLLLFKGEGPLARAQAAAFRKALPFHGLPVFYDGLSAFIVEDFPAAREVFQQLMRGPGLNPRVALLAGTTEARLGNLPQAENLLSKAMSAMPNEPQVRHELARVQMRQGNPARAIATLEPLLSVADPAATPTAVWMLAGQAHSTAGDFKRADVAFENARRGRPDKTMPGTDHARSLVMRGDIEGGVRELRALAEREGDNIDADTALAATLTAKRDFAGAVKALEVAAEKRPNTPMVDMMRAHALGGLNDRDGVANALNLALRKEATYLPAIERLAALDMAAGRPEAAKGRFKALLARQPRSTPALLAMADITRAEGGSAKDAAAWLDKAIAVNPRDPRTWLAAITHQARRGDVPGALSWAQRGATAMPDDSDLALRLGELQMASGDTEQALATLSRLVGLKPNVAPIRMAYTRALVAGKKYAPARAQLVRALELDPEIAGGAALNVSLSLLEGKPDQAMKAAQAVQQQNPQSSQGWWLVSEVHSRRNEAKEAMAAGRQALAVQPSSESALRLLGLLTVNAQNAEASTLVQGWIKDHPNDALFHGQAAVWADAQANVKLAESLYRRALELTPDSPVALNNLAYFLVRNERVQEGLPMAQQAVQRAPDVATFLDTLARAQGAAGDKDNALKTQLKAVELAPRNNDFRLELARRYLASGETKKAKNELERLSDLAGQFKKQDEVQKLLRQTGG